MSFNLTEKEIKDVKDDFRMWCRCMWSITPQSPERTLHFKEWYSIYENQLRHIYYDSSKKQTYVQKSLQFGTDEQTEALPF